jgi:hypothetical protein
VEAPREAPASHRKKAFNTLWLTRLSSKNRPKIIKPGDGKRFGAAKSRGRHLLKARAEISGPNSKNLDWWRGSKTLPPIF